MKSAFLFPHVFNKIGWLILIPCLISIVWLTATGNGIDAGLTVQTFAAINDELLGNSSYFTIVENDITDELLLCLTIAGCLMIGFSKRRNEDEYIAQIRHESLVWAVYVNFGFMILATLTVFGMAYFQVMMIGIISLLAVFLLRFHLMLYKLKKSAGDDQ